MRAARGVGDGRGHRDADAQHPARRPGRTGTSADQHACRAGAHEVEGGLVRRAPADHHGDLVVADEVLQVQGLAVARHVLRRHDRALDHEQIRFGTQDVRGQPEGARGGAGDGHRVALRLELPDALLDEIGLHGLGVELLHPAGRLVDGQRGDLLEDRLRLGVAGPEPLEVQHARARRGDPARRPRPATRRCRTATPSPGARSGRRRSPTRCRPLPGRASGDSARRRCRRSRRHGVRTCRCRSRRQPWRRGPPSRLGKGTA